MTTASAPPRQQLGLRLALLGFAQFIFAIDFNIVYVALPDIGRALGFSAQSLQWVVSAYAVGLGGFLLGGRAADRLGPRRMFVVALGIYGIASLAGGLASEDWILVAARAVQGFGGALLFPATLTLINTSFEEGPARNRAMSIWGAAGSAGLAAGALLGGVLTNYFGWTWVFYINIPLTVLAGAAAPMLLPPDTAVPRGRGGFDLPGALLATSGSTLVVFAIANGPEVGWASAWTAGPLGMGILLLAGLVLVEWRSRDPLIPLRTLRNGSLIATLVVIFVYMGALAGAYYMLTTYLQPVLGYDALEAGLAFLPLGLLSMVGAGRLTPFLLARWGVRTTLFTGMILTGIATAVLVAGMSADGSYWALVPGIVLWGLFGGLTFTTMFVAAASGVAPGEQGVASGLASTFQQIGAAVILAVLVATANSATADGSAAAVVDGLQLAGWIVAALTAAGALVALGFRQRT